jgi:hypothetical protein
MKLKSILNFIVFSILVFLIFQCNTYLFRGTGTERWRIINIKEDQDLDVIFLGGSSILAYWQPPRAWNEFGFKSFNCATNNFPMEATKYMIKYGMKYHKPDLWVVEMRPFYAYTPAVEEGGFRSSSDSLGLLEPIRYEYMHDVISNRKLEKNDDILSYYLDLSFYHTNYWNLNNAYSWFNIFNTYYDHENQIAGWEWREDGVADLEKPKGFETENIAELDPYVEQCLVELLQFCRENELNMLFLGSPFCVNKESTMIYNSYKRIVESYGYDFLDTNFYYDEMEVDFSTDFHDPSHMNLLGAEKFTNFVGAYIVNQYNIEDHRDDGNSDVQKWNSYYEKFIKEEIEHRNITFELINER